MVQQNLFAQAIKETVEDSQFDYIRINNDNLNKCLEEINNSERIGIKYYSNENKITHITISNGKNYYFPEEFIEKLRPIEDVHEFHTFFFHRQDNGRDEIIGERIECATRLLLQKRLDYLGFVFVFDLCQLDDCTKDRFGKLIFKGGFRRVVRHGISQKSGRTF